ncbi:hypothetical protein EG329_012459 [Mollisiaceae sp. DMI_Dod_QoI]|nr:hypothetical protein EG329_012459 [Helotiales sp. DMI_Dod_QoI]
MLGLLKSLLAQGTFSHLAMSKTITPACSGLYMLAIQAAGAFEFFVEEKTVLYDDMHPPPSVEDFLVVPRTLERKISNPMQAHKLYSVTIKVQPYVPAGETSEPQMIEEVATESEQTVLVLYGGNPIDISAYEHLVNAILFVHLGRPVQVAKKWRWSRRSDTPRVFTLGIEPEDTHLDIDLDLDYLEGIVIKVRIANIGFVAGHEVVQVYILGIKPAVPRAREELKAFDKIWLEPGEAKTATIEISERNAFSWWDHRTKGGEC